MSLKNKIAYTLLPFALLLTACAGGGIGGETRELEGLNHTQRVELKYAEQFSVDRYEGGYSLITTPDGRYLIVPEGKNAPEKPDGDIKIIQQPAEDIYLAATAAMSLFDALDEGSKIRFSGAKAEDWSIAYARDAMEKGEMVYAGKYREPDYELLLSGGCKLAVESTMILHAPDVKEKLEELGITVFTDYSSYEQSPLGRCEWIKVYGEITGKSDEAAKLFDEQESYITQNEGTGKTVVFFYINSSGQAVTRKSGDYVTSMIEAAGGENVFKNLGAGQASSSVTMEMEEFYTGARDADFIIYNSAIGGAVHSVDEIIAKNSLIADFKAVKDGNVWCTNDNLYQDTMKTGEIIAEMNAIFTNGTDGREPRFLYKIEGGEAHE